MAATPQTNFRLSPNDLARLDELARRWGPIKPLSRTDVVRELIRRATTEKPEPRKRRVVSSQ